jgi:isopentenyl-diphosphate delta-isomerase
MNSDKSITSSRKREHLEISLSGDVTFKTKTTGFENYDFLHDPITEVDINKINFRTKFFGKKIDYPFLISCMTGGTSEAENVNAQLATVAENLTIPIGVGSQRQALENDDFVESFKTVRKNAPNVPVLGNIGASQVVQFNSMNPIRKLIEMIDADALVIHVNPLQELLQGEGETEFKGLLKSLRFIVKNLDVPVIVKEVGAGISYEAASKLLETDVKGIDVAGAGGTSWAGIEILRNNNNDNYYFWDWGLPTSFCIKDVYKLKKKHKFTLIGSGGINSAADAAKAFALGADIVASARMILLELQKNEIDGVQNLIISWFDTIRKIMYLTGSKSVRALRKNKIIRKDLLY